jgi:hypothetical protein
MSDLATKMFDEAAQENHDGYEYDLLQAGAEKIRELEKALTNAYIDAERMGEVNLYCFNRGGR